MKIPESGKRKYFLYEFLFILTVPENRRWKKSKVRLIEFFSNGKTYIDLVDASWCLNEYSWFSSCRTKILVTPEMARRSGVEEGEIVRSACKDRNDSSFSWPRLSCIRVFRGWFLVLFEKEGVFVWGPSLINEKSINGRMAGNSEERQDNKLEITRAKEIEYNGGEKEMGKRKQPSSSCQV